jgi:hypothetical protein
MEMSGQLHVPAPLSPDKSPRYPLNRRLGGPQGQFARAEGEESHIPLWTLIIFWCIHITYRRNTGARGSGVGWDTATNQKVAGSSPDEVDFFQLT